MKKIFTITAIITIALVFTNTLNAQTVYRSFTTGNWGTFGSWEISTDGGANWNATVSGQTPGASNDVTVRSPHVITIDASGKNAKLITIVSGATLKAGVLGTERTQRVNGATLQNDGTLGGANDGITIELNTANAVGGFTLTGSGTTNISRFRMAGGNLNPLNTVVIDQNINCLVGSNGITSNYALNANGGSNTDNYVLTINATKTVTVTGGYWNSSGASGGAATSFGNYTYNINGTLDMSGSTAVGNSTFIGSNDPTKAVTVNINGTVKLPTSGLSSLILNESTATGQLGPVTFNINNGGLLDGSLAPISTTTTTLAPRFFNISGTGKLKRTVGAADVLFAVGTSSSYSPATINNAGTSDNFSVNVSNTITNTSPTANVVNKQWKITEDVVGGSDATLKLGWLTTDQSAGFNPANPVFILGYNGSAYVPFPATLSGSGTALDPYIATAAGITTFAEFIVTNNPSAAPVNFISTKAFSKLNGVQVEWQTANEFDVQNFVVEHSADGRNFTAIGTVNAITNSRNNSYNYFDATPNAGNNFYRIRANELFGSAKYTPVLKVNINSKAAEMIIANNPIQSGNLNLQLSGMVKGNYNLVIFNSNGQQVLFKSINMEGSSLSQSIALPALTSGIYVVQLRSNDIKLATKVTID
ncbi:MAG: T9SS type A sorting domain-containing protein [Ferruginibacter sp.]